MNKRTVALTTEQYKKIIKTMMSGFVDENQNIVKPNRRIATALTLEATVKMYLTKVCKKLGYKGIKTYHFSALWANVKDFDKTY